MVLEFCPPVPPTAKMASKLLEDLVVVPWKLVSSFSRAELSAGCHLTIDIILIIISVLISNLLRLIQRRTLQIST